MMAVFAINLTDIPIGGTQFEHQPMWTPLDAIPDLIGGLPLTRSKPVQTAFDVLKTRELRKLPGSSRWVARGELNALKMPNRNVDMMPRENSSFALGCPFRARPGSDGGHYGVAFQGHTRFVVEPVHCRKKFQAMG